MPKGGNEQAVPTIEQSVVEQLINSPVSQPSKESVLSDLPSMAPIFAHSEQNFLTGNTVDMGQGRIASVQSGSVNNPKLNKGKPTLIPFVWNGRVVDQAEAEELAIRAQDEQGIVWPEFEDHDAATRASIRASNVMGL